MSSSSPMDQSLSAASVRSRRIGVIRRVLLVAAGVFLLLLLIFVIVVPSPINALAWQPPAVRAATGVLAANAELSSGEVILPGRFDSPEDITFDDAGTMFTTGIGGEILRVTFDASGIPAAEVLTDRANQPLDMRFDQDGNLIVADWGLGIISVAPDGSISTIVPLETLVDGVPFRRPDGVAIGSDGTIYFSEGSHRDGDYDSVREIFEQRPYGRLLAFDPNNDTVRVLIPEVWFANGVLLAPDESHVLVADQYRYRIARYWLTGQQAGTWDYLIESLPGFPHNLHPSSDGNLWVAIYTERNMLLDSVHPLPFVKNQLAKLPPNVFLHAPAQLEGSPGGGKVLKVDWEGNILLSLQAPPAWFPTISAAYEYDGWLYMGSLDSDTVLRYRLATAGD